MIVDLGSEPKDPYGLFDVVAHLYSEKENSYVYGWKGGIFNNYDDAFEFWDQWEPSENEIYSIMKRRREDGDLSHHELEIGIYSEFEEDLAFTNRSIDAEHELKRQRTIHVNQELFV